MHCSCLEAPVLLLVLLLVFFLIPRSRHASVGHLREGYALPFAWRQLAGRCDQPYFSAGGWWKEREMLRIRASTWAPLFRAFYSDTEHVDQLQHRKTHTVIIVSCYALSSRFASLNWLYVYFIYIRALVESKSAVYLDFLFLFIVSDKETREEGIITKGWLTVALYMQMS